MARSESNSGKRVARTFMRLPTLGREGAVVGVRDHGAVIVARIALVAAAAAVIVALATWLHQVRLFTDARAAAVPARTPAQVDAAAKMLHDAARHTPDTLPETGEAFVLIRAGRDAEGAAI